MSDKVELLQGTLDLIVLRALSTMGPQHAYGLASRLEQVAEHQPGDALSRAGSPRAEGLDQGRVAADREQPRGEVLQHHQGRHARAREAGGTLAPARRPRGQAAAE